MTENLLTKRVLVWDYVTAANTNWESKDYAWAGFDIGQGLWELVGPVPSDSTDSEFLQ